MHNIHEFTKLFKVKIPVEKHFDYYIGLLRQSPEYGDLDKQIAAFEALEARLATKDQSLKSFHHQTLNAIKEHLQLSAAYRLLEDVKLNLLARRSSLTFQPEPEKHYVSIDIRSANWTALKCFDSAELPHAWEDFCSQWDETLAMSKSFRQIVFGNLNPKRFVRVQEHVIYHLHEKLANKFKIVGVSQDELIVEAAPDLGNSVSFTHDIAGHRGTYVEFKLTEFTQRKVGKDQFVRTIYENGEFHHRTLLGIPGNQFYMFFKKFVLEKSIEDRDLLFVQDDMIAKWVTLPETVK